MNRGSKKQIISVCLTIVGILVIIFSLLTGFLESVYLYQEELSKGFEVVVDALIGLRTLMGFLLGCILIGLGSIANLLVKILNELKK